MNKELNEAIFLVENGQTDEGLKKLAKIEKTLNDEEKFQLAETYYQWGRTDEALKLLEQLRKVYRDESAVSLLYAEILIDLNEEDRAMEILNTIDEEDEAYPQALILLADLYQLEGLYEVSEQKLKEAKRMLPDEKVIDFALAELYFHIGKYHQAIDYYEEVLKDHEELMNVNLYNRMAEALSASGHFEEALHYYEKAAETENPDTLFAYGCTALAAGYTKTAIQQFERVKEQDPSYQSLYLNLAKCYEQEEMLDESFAAVQEGLKQDPFHKELYVSGGKIALKLGDVPTAEKLLKEALVLDPGYVEAVITLASVWHSVGKYAEIVELLTDIIENNEEYAPEFDFYLAKAYHQLEQYEDALNHYENAYNFLKSDQDFLEEFAYFLLEEGDRKRAKELFEKALEKDPANTEYENILLELDDNLPI